MQIIFLPQTSVDIWWSTRLYFQYMFNLCRVDTYQFQVSIKIFSCYDALILFFVYNYYVKGSADVLISL